jgi:hypothetical protein
MIQVAELHRTPGQILRRVPVEKERLLIERAGYPVAVLTVTKTAVEWRVGRLRKVFGLFSEAIAWQKAERLPQSGSNRPYHECDVLDAAYVLPVASDPHLSIIWP